MNNNDGFQRVKDFFDQLSEIWQHVLNLMYSNNTLDSKGTKLSDLLDVWTRYLNNHLSAYVHPAFIPIIAFAIVIACAHKLLKWTSKD